MHWCAARMGERERQRKVDDRPSMPLMPFCSTLTSHHHDGGSTTSLEILHVKTTIRLLALIAVTLAMLS